MSFMYMCTYLESIGAYDYMNRLKRAVITAKSVNAFLSILDQISQVFFTLLQMKV